jgi:hypothetical protein
MEAKIKQYVGRRAFLPVGTIKVSVKVLDFKVAWGHDRALVAPITGEGKQWVGTDKLLMS